MIPVSSARPARRHSGAFCLRAAAKQQLLCTSCLGWWPWSASKFTALPSFSFVRVIRHLFSSKPKSLGWRLCSGSVSHPLLENRAMASVRGVDCSVILRVEGVARASTALRHRDLTSVLSRCSCAIDGCCSTPCTASLSRTCFVSEPPTAFSRVGTGVLCVDLPPVCHPVQGDMMTKRQLLLVLAAVVALWCQRVCAVRSSGADVYGNTTKKMF